MLRQNRVVIDMDAIRNNYRILKENVPAGVEVGFRTYGGLTWGALPDDENWFHAVR